MQQHSTISYWAQLITQLRDSYGWSQEAFAAQLNSSQSVVSRWEKGHATPSFQHQQRLEALAEEAGLSSLAGVSAVVRSSPYPMLLVSRQGVVMAASPSSGFEEDKTVTEQTPKAERGAVDKFNDYLEATPFWQTAGTRIEYSHNGKLAAVAVSVGVRKSIFGVVQRLP